jgi:hypothetical protein
MQPRINPHDPTRLVHEYNMLGLADLITARDKHHLELMGKKNVIGTAVGLYLIRRTDPWPPKKTPAKRPARTLANSEVRPYSWPCILVFVRDWEDERQLHAEDRVPPSLYLEDDRKVPVCVVEAPPVLVSPPAPRNVLFPTSRMGGGFPVIARVQEREHVASIGCLLSDGHTTYALTSRHVTGEPGEVVYTRVGGEQVRIGVSSRKQLTRKSFSDVYPSWPAKKTFLHMDVGLIRVDDVTRWTAQVYGIGRIDEVARLGNDSISLRLIDTPVKAYGCASGLMEGAIKGLFYRYAVSSDNDNVSDFLIGARDGNTSFATHPGDSGTTWFIDPEPQAGKYRAKGNGHSRSNGNGKSNGGSNPMQENGLQPIAVQWGGLLFADGSGTQQSCALATCLSTVCNLLDVDVIRDWNIGGPDYWGETGHYTVGALSCLFDLKGLPGLQKLLRNNMDRIGFKPADLKRNEKVLRNRAHYAFVPLADVADDVWRNTRPSDGNNHFADMDEKALSGPFKGKDLLTLTKTPANIEPQVWVDFYKSLPGTNPGALPFRVWQIYNEMVAFAKQGDALRFLAAAGILAHYVGDACQPLHVSRLHHGNPPVKKGTVAYNVHSVYETQMLNENASDIVDGISALVDGKSLSPTFSSGHGAAARVIDLMRTTFTKLPPSKIVETYNSGTTPALRLSLLWQKHGPGTITVMADGCRCLADIWASAWKEGGGEQIAQNKLGAADEALLEQCYNEPGFLPSVALNTLVGVLAGGVAPPPAGGGGKKKKKKAKAKK